MEEDAEPEVMDAGLIGAAQHVEHYEMAGARNRGYLNFVMCASGLQFSVIASD